jgi:hypothetical protein
MTLILADGKQTLHAFPPDLTDFECSGLKSDLLDTFHLSANPVECEGPEVMAVANNKAVMRSGIVASAHVFRSANGMPVIATRPDRIFCPLFCQGSSFSIWC